MEKNQSIKFNRLCGLKKNETYQTEKPYLNVMRPPIINQLLSFCKMGRRGQIPLNRELRDKVLVTFTTSKKHGCTCWGNQHKNEKRVGGWSSQIKFSAHQLRPNEEATKTLEILQQNYLALLKLETHF